MNMFSLNLLSSGSGFNWYGFLIGSGMVICIIIAYFMAKKRGYYPDLVFDISIICIPLAIVGARLYYVIFDILGNDGSWTFADIIGLGKHGLAGLAIYGGLIGACIGAVILHFVKRKKPPQKRATFLQMADFAFTVIILGQIIGRWGNFANQEAYGQLITNEALQWFPFGVLIEGQWYQATFFYESFFNCFGFALLMWIYNGKRKSFDGFSLSVYCIFYGLVRFFIEGLRSDSLYILPGVRVSQVLSALLVLFGIVFIISHVYLARSKGLKPFIFVPKDKLNSSYYGYDTCIMAHPYVQEGEVKPGFFAKLFGKASSEEVDSEEESTDKPEEVDDDYEDLVDIESEKMEDSDWAEKDESSNHYEQDFNLTVNIKNSDLTDDGVDKKEQDGE